MQARSKKILMVAGEASADTHGAALAQTLRIRDPNLSIFGVGGDHMAKAGVQLLAHAQDMAVTGIFEVFFKLFQIGSIYFRLVKFIKSQKPDLVVLMDYPDFNLRLAKKVHQLGIPIVYYISPQVWAWRVGRIKKIKKYVTKMLVVFPFEEAFYKRYGVDATFVGHPLVSGVQLQNELNKNEEEYVFEGHLGARVGMVLENRDSPPQRDCPYFPKSERAVSKLPAGQFDAYPRTHIPLHSYSAMIALLPGSRKNELKYLLSSMLDAAEILQTQLPNICFKLPVAPTLNKKAVEAEIKKRNLNIEVSRGNMQDVVKNSDVVVTCSGTATLETALLEKPMVIVYRLNWISYVLGKLILRKLKNFGMPNIILGQTVVPELLQYEVTGKNIARHVMQYFVNPELKSQTVEKLKAVRERLKSKNSQQQAVHKIMELLDDRWIQRQRYLSSDTRLKTNISALPNLYMKIYIIFKPLLWFLSKLYLLAVVLRNIFYDKQIFRSKRVGATVISIGNITIGGTGKTPLTLALCRLFQNQGKRVGIVSRGYRRQSQNAWDCVTDGEKLFLTSRKAGDEPWLLATKLSKVPVYVGSNRAEVSKVLLKNHAVDILLLDDGFQHRALCRDLDILTLDATVMIKGERLLPLGPFREPLRSIRRATLLVLTRTHQISKEALFNLKNKIKNIHPQAQVFEANYEPKEIFHWVKKEVLPLSELKGKRIFAFAGIGNPASFKRVIESLEGQLVGFKTYLDHFPYRKKDTHHLLRGFESAHADVLLTTEKDAVRLPEGLIQQWPLYTLNVDLTLTQGFENEILSRF